MENERIIRALERIVELQEEILFQLQGGSYATDPSNGKWIGSLKVQEILGIGRITITACVTVTALSQNKSAAVPAIPFGDIQAERSFFKIGNFPAFSKKPEAVLLAFMQEKSAR